jgi:threonine/homoserine/homoserine lactone efflux protein
MSRVALKGLITGLILQIAIGPIFFLIVNITLQDTLLNGLSAVVAVTIVDYLYIALAIAGIGKLLEKESVKTVLGVISSIVLIIFGSYIIVKSLSFATMNVKIDSNFSNISASFISAFILTISSPLTIVFWTSIFTARAIEYSLSKKELLVFGLSAGFATPVFLSISIVLVTLLKSSISPLVVQLGNRAVGLLLIVYGITRLIKNIKPKFRRNNS